MIARLALLFLLAAAPDPNPYPARIGADAVWDPPAGFVAAVHAACDARGEAFGDCFSGEMRKAGASDAAVAFARKTGNLGYLRRFRADGPVAIAWAVLPFRANENSACYLVNGLPPMIGVDDLSLLSRD